MAGSGRSSSSLLRVAVLTLAAFALIAPRLSFVAPPQPTRALRGGAVASYALPKPAVEETAEKAESPQRANEGFSLPKPDLGLMNRQARLGQTFDQDKRGNMWAVGGQTTRATDDEMLPAYVYIPFVVLLTIGAIIFFAQQTGQDARFGGVIGDGSLAYGD
mmetsp:Transcript_103797/g.292768  ORF Transcript_103797/g.292768 Transcript_103797/m.292768 type:complete len:161 (+) Transcript_103797:73-555(+)|eukprot:CAMPEP_0117560396 /NCGR_PEP_ID=MMETSP0784-20121206/53852_1 /TAXON_ID=39447 /ORGANISM="" /LENGTH=160 /DNA_ID=CAMNT_0005357799 /DNA_START=67 /DNA_END=549 /DNA_ORIENTATION=-